MIRGNKREMGNTVPVRAAADAGIHNRFDIEVRDGKTGELKQQAQALNVICNALWTRLFAPANYFNYIVYGSGSGTPAATDTELFTKIGGVSAGTPVESLDYPNGVYSLRKQMQIDETTAVGETITEVGIGYDATHIVTHAMLQDMNGNPITIEKTDTDIITFYATVYVHFNSAGYQNGKIQVMAENGFLAGLAGNGVGGSVSVYPGEGRTYGKFGSKSSAITFSAANKQMSFSGLRFAVGEANGNIYGFSLNWNSVFAFFISADVFDHSPWAITGEAVATGDGETTDFATAFPIRSGARIYVNGVEDSSVTIDNGVFYTMDIATGSHNLLDGIDSSGNPTTRPTCAEGGRYALEGICENKNLYPVTRIESQYQDISYSNDLQNWVGVPSGTQQSPVIARYWRGVWLNVWDTHISLLYNDSGTTTNIHFTTPPPAGAVITADYIPDCIPKDTDHVFDLSFTLTLGEYTGT